MHGWLTITPAELTVHADVPQPRLWSGQLPLTYGYSGLQGGDTAAIFSGSLTTPAGPQSMVGIYAIGQATLSAGANHLIDYIPGSLTVIPPVPTLAVQMPSILNTLGQDNNFIDPSRNMDRGGAPWRSIISAMRSRF